MIIAEKAGRDEVDSQEEEKKINKANVY